MVGTRHIIIPKLILRFPQLFIFIIWCNTLFAQSDSSNIPIGESFNDYYIDFSENFLIKPYTLFKLNTLEIKNEGGTLKLSPNSPTAIGIGVNYKFAGIALGFGLPHSSESITKYGNTTRLDLQLSAFAKNFGIDAHLQMYQGYYNENPEDFISWEKDYYPQLPDMSTISIGTSLFYVFNNKRYSNKAGIVRTQVQNKSAGSFLTGLFFSYDEADSPGGFFPQELPDSLFSDFDLKAFRYIATGINLGYAYTWVITPKFFLNVSAISGGGYKYIRASDNNGLSDAERHIHGQLLLRSSIGFEHNNFLAGLSASTIIRSISYKSYEIDLATEQIRVYVGYRFPMTQKNKPG